MEIYASYFAAPSSPKMKGPLTLEPTSVKIGDDILLSCDAEGGPEPTIHWFHDSTLLSGTINK